MIPEVLAQFIRYLLLAFDQLSSPVGHIEARNRDTAPDWFNQYNITLWHFALNELIHQMIRILHHIIVIDHTVF